MNDQGPVLIAPLNWGLGHATRCIPLIRSLRDLGQEVHIASDGSALDLLSAEFPDLPTYALPAYDVRYHRDNMIQAMAGQLPKIARAIRQEHRVTQQLIDRFHFRGIISDNRYGVRSKRVNSVVLCHQINIRVPNPAIQWAVRFGHRQFLRAFHEVWIPDFEHAPGLSGELGHQTGLKSVRYLGPLTRFSSGGSQLKKRKVLAILSGPEPQRSQLEALLTQQILALDLSAMIVCGNTEKQEEEWLNPQVKRISYLRAEHLQTAIHDSELVVCRSGYSSLMDLKVLGKKALLIPTPGQTEQEYLAHNFAQEAGYVYQNQNALNLPEGLAQLQKQDAPKPLNAAQLYDQQRLLLQDWLANT
ncbi:MAG: glycosyltransferase [Bacteroidota bacterium]